MTTRQAVTDTDLSESSWNSGAGIQKANAIYDVVADDIYINYACGITQRVAGGNAVPHISVTTQGTLDGCENVDTNNYSQMLASLHATYGGSGGVLIENILTGLGGLVKEKHTHVLALELRDEDEHAEVIGTNFTTSDVFADGDAVTLTFTPATDGEYLIIADCQTKHADVAQSLEVRLLVDGNPYHLARVEPASVDEWRPWTCVLGAITGETLGELDANSHTLKIQFRSRDGSTTASIRQARIMCLRLDTFKNFYYTEALPRQFTTATSYQTKLSLAPTIMNSGNHLVFVSAHIDGIQTALFNTDARILIDPSGSPVTLLEPTVRMQRSRGEDDWSCALYRMRNLSAGASSLNTWNFDLRKSADVLGAVGMEHAAICVIELAEAVVSTRIVSLGQTVTRSKIVLAG